MGYRLRWEPHRTANVPVIGRPNLRSRISNDCWLQRGSPRVYGGYSHGVCEAECPGGRVRTAGGGHDRPVSRIHNPATRR